MTIAKTLAIGALCAASGLVGYIQGKDSCSPRTVHLEKDVSGQYRVAVYAKTGDYTGFSHYKADEGKEFTVSLDGPHTPRQN